ncbi:MAG TPA: RnfABCDGE type electron transport complex subunit B [bacterium]|nr:RnfABCDGE type electron transport complex subunit B [bacterium]HEX68562.1 RnfABCDGE type electron transport complex subunit B [bacterium]
MFALILMSVLGLVFSLILVISDRLFRVEEDKRLKVILEVLPGINCGACGYPSCRQAAEALLKGEADPGVCVAGGEEVAKKLVSILGGGINTERVKKVAVLHCGAKSKKRKKSAHYEGIESCLAAHITGAEEACFYGCLGYGDCEKVCPVNAISLKDGLPEIDHEKCVGCGKCVEVCPRNLFELVPYEKPLYWVACNNPEPGKKVKEVCSKGCIGCKLCSKLSDGVFEIENNLARINRDKSKEKSVDWEKVAEKCPSHCILSSS